jgi:hypothetical protein
MRRCRSALNAQRDKGYGKISQIGPTGKRSRVLQHIPPNSGHSAAVAECQLMPTTDMPTSYRFDFFFFFFLPKMLFQLSV